MLRSARFDHPVDLELEDGTHLSVGLGPCLVDDESNGVTLLIEPPVGEHAVRVSPAKFSKLLARHDLVYTSW